MRSVRIALALALALGALVCLFGVATAIAADPSTPAGSEPAAIPENAAEMAEIASGQRVPEPVPAADITLARPLAPEMVEINAAIAAERTRIGDLTTRLNAATDEAAALALVQEIEATKQGTELTILGVQARYARAAGREAQAQEIEAAISRLTAVIEAPAAITATRSAAPVQRPADGER